MTDVERPDDEPLEPPHPRETTVFFGHADAEGALLESYRGGRIPHAWLIGGPRGIGKATLAYRMARFVLAQPDPAAAAVQAARSLEIDAAHPVTRRIAAQAHTDLLALERTETDTGTLRTVITVDEVRRTVSFFGSTAGEGGWRIAIVDSADELQFPQASNALLKVLEEPPRDSLFLIVSHAPGRLLPTIRSRCRTLTLHPLDEADVARAMAAALDKNPKDSAIRKAAAAADGSIARGLMLLGGGGLEVREQVSALLAKLPTTDARALHALGEALSGGDDTALTAFADAVREWLTMQLARPQDSGRLARVAVVWEKVNSAVRDTEMFNLERKPLVFSVFDWLAQASRR